MDEAFSVTSEYDLAKSSVASVAESEARTLVFKYFTKSFVEMPALLIFAVNPGNAFSSFLVLI